MSPGRNFIQHNKPGLNKLLPWSLYHPSILPSDAIMAPVFVLISAARLIPSIPFLVPSRPLHETSTAREKTKFFFIHLIIPF